jgi:hypothetical protein
MFVALCKVVCVLWRRKETGGGRSNGRHGRVGSVQEVGFPVGVRCPFLPPVGSSSGFHPSKPKTALKSPEPRPAIKPSSAPLSLSRRSPSFSCLHTHNRHPRRPKLLLSQTIITRLPILLHPQSSFPCRSPLSLSLCCLYKIVDNARH